MQGGHHGADVIAVIGRESLSCRADLSNDVIIDSWCFLHERQLGRRTDQRRFAPHHPTCRLNARSKHRIRDVCAIPCQQILHSVDRRGRNVERVSGGASRNGNGPCQLFRQCDHLISLILHRQTGDHSQPIRRGSGVTRSTLEQDQRRDIKLKTPPCLPPFPGHLLLSRSK
jgi:hypothetical protein